MDRKELHRFGGRSRRRGGQEKRIDPGFGPSGDSKKRWRNCSKPDSLTALFFRTLRKVVVKCVEIEVGPIYPVRLSYRSELPPQNRILRIAMHDGMLGVFFFHCLWASANEFPEFLSMMTHRSVLVSRAWSFSRGRFAWALALGGLLTGAQGACAQEKYLEWSDNTGRFKVDAQYLRVEGEQLVLKRADGREIKIPFERLSPESLELARTKSGISIPKGSSPKPAPSEPKGASPGATSKATPSKAVPEKTSPESSTPVTKFQDNMDPKEFIDLVFKQTSQDNYIVLWDAMPASKQQQLEELMVEFARKVDPRSFDMIRRTRNSLVEILRKQQKFILNSSVLAMPSDLRQEFEPVYPAMVDVADHLVAKELLDGKRMQQGNMRGLLDTYLTRLLKSVEKAIVILPADNPIRSQYEDAKILNKPNWTVEKTSSTSATLSIPPAPGGPPPPPPIALVLSEGRWLPEDLVKNWDMGISQAKGFIATMNPEQIQQGITTGMFVANAPLNSLKNAKSQEEFDKVLGELAGLASGFGQMAGPGGPGAGGRPGLIPPGAAPAGSPGSGFSPR